MNQDEDRFDENPDSEDSEVHENQHEVDDQENQLPKEIAVKSEIKEAACSSEPNIEESEAYDTFEDNIHYLNKKYQPYRDPKDDKEDVEDNESDSDKYSCTTTTSTIMDPGMVRSKVRKSLLAKIKTEKRRLRNKGESALCTEKLREINDTIKSSLNFD